MGYERRAGCLPWAGGSLRRRRQDLRLILQELAHEAEVGGDHTPPLLDVVEGVLQAELLGLHEVSHADGGRAGDPSLAVDQDLASLFPDTIWKEEKRGRMSWDWKPKGQDTRIKHKSDQVLKMSHLSKS